MANENRLIDLDEAIDALGVEYYDIKCKHFLEERPIVDAEPVKHGRWVCLEAEIGFFACSECDHRILRAKCNYCPNCGAKMDGGNGDGKL